MRGAAGIRGISLRSTASAARLRRLRGVLPPIPVSKLVTGALAAALVVAALQEGFDIRWALGAAALASSADHKSPRTRSNESPIRSPALRALMSAHLFGLASTPAGGLSGAAAQRDTKLVLTGTIATPDPSSGFAMIGASAEAARVHPVGEALSGGVVLRAVYRDHVLVERAGQVSAVFFLRTGKPAFTAAAIRSQPSAGRAMRTDGDGEQSQRQHIDDAIEAESERTAAFVHQQPFYSDGQLRGIVLEPGSDPAMLAQLGLKAGDVLEHVDGSVVADPDRLDFLRQRLQSGQPVVLSVIRPGVGAVDVKISGTAVAGMIEN
jgi:type II secretion system protein C